MAGIESRFEVFVLDAPHPPLFRGCHGRDLPSLEAALRSNYEARRNPHPADLRATALHMAVSLFEDRDLVVRLGRRHPDRIGTHVARIELQPGAGVCLAKTGGQGHWSVWGVPETLAGWVTDVEEVRK